MSHGRVSAIDFVCAVDPETGIAPLTWAQQFMWGVIAAAGGGHDPFDLLLRRDFETPVALTDAVDLVRGFVLRHPVLRIRFVIVDGVPAQRVETSGMVPIVTYPAQATANVRALIPHTTESQPCRPLLLLNEDGAVTSIAMRLSHLVTDRFGLELLENDLAAMPVGAVETAAPTSRSPLELAAFEGSSEGSAVERRATEYAAGLYAEAPSSMWTRPRLAPQSDRYWYGQLRSAELLGAVGTLIRDRGLSRTGIVAGALATVAACCAKQDSALMFTISSNRFASAWRAYPGSLSQEAILHIPVGDLVTDTMAAAAATAMRSLRRARYAPSALDAVRRAAEARRGTPFDGVGSALVLNLLVAEAVAPKFTVAESPDSFRWNATTNEENLGFYVDVEETDSEFVLGVRLDTTLMPPDEAEAWLRTVAWMVIRSAAGDVPTISVRSRLTPYIDRAPG